MPVTKRGDVGNQIAKLWASQLFYQAEKRTFWHKHEGPEGSSSPVIRKDDLTRQAGDTVKVDMALALTGTGSSGDTSLLEGNEEAPKFRQLEITVDSLQHAVRWSKLSRVLISHNLRQVGLTLLEKHLAARLDDQIFNEFSGGTGATYTEANLPTTMKWFAGAATSIGTVTSAMTPTLNDISDIKAYAANNNLIEPIGEGDSDTGEEMYGLVLHP